MLINRSKYTIFPIKIDRYFALLSTYPNTSILDTLNIGLIKRTFFHDFLTRKNKFYETLNKILYHLKSDFFPSSIHLNTIK